MPWSDSIYLTTLPPMTAKQQFFDQVLGGLRQRSAYFSRDSIQAAAESAGLAIKRPTLAVYLHQAVKQGLIHDAGRGWYSRLAEPVKLDLHTCAKLVREVEKAFPLLDFTVWSTAQLNPWMHHLLAKPVHFLHAPREALESVAEALRDKGWEVAVNPGKREAAKVIRPGEKMVVLRPTLAKQPPMQMGRQDSIEKILVDLLAESGRSGVIGRVEVERLFAEVASRNLVQVPVLQRYAEHREVSVPDFEELNNAGK